MSAGLETKPSNPIIYIACGLINDWSHVHFYNLNKTLLKYLFKTNKLEIYSALFI